MIPGPLGQIVIGLVMMVAAVVLAFLMVMRLIEPTLGLCFAAFILSVGGILVGMIGVAGYLRPRGGE
ncbi:MAG: hypothetical protein Kow0097_10970 [Candidatus Bipolaricaulota bacterium]|nr:hypothetical protein [Candidatus Bipolaricaulota bacterium]